MQSGIVESYALGLATPGESEEFEQLLPHFPELKDSLAEFEYHLELFSIDHEAPPPVGTREKIEARMRELPAIPYPAGRQYRRQHGSEYVSVKETSSHIRVHKIWRAIFIGVFILSKIFLILAIYYYLEYRHAQGQIIKLNFGH